MEPWSETKPTKPLAEIDLEGCSYGHGDLLSSTTPDKGHGGWKTLLLAYKTLGVVFGGLVTSPLYVYPSMNLKSPSEDDYLGILSIMFWTLTLIGVAKYVCIALNADDHGEGGTFALYSLLCRHVNIGVLSNPTRQVDPLLGLSHKSWYRNAETHSRMGRFIEKSVVARRILLFIAMLGMCMLIGDGILTPAISGVNFQFEENLESYVMY